MVSINLKKLISKHDLASVIEKTIAALEEAITIRDAGGAILVGEGDRSDSHQYPIEVADEIIGWVTGNEKAACVADILGHIARKDLDKKALAIDALDKYEEINFLYEFSAKIAACIGIKEITEVAIAEARQLLDVGGASVMLFSNKIGALETISAWGAEEKDTIPIRPGEGISGHVLLSGRAEIVNDVCGDFRYIARGKNAIRSLICAPLTAQNGTIGVINISNCSLANYTSQDLKLFAALASQTAAALENALWHENQLKEERIKNNLARYLSPQVVEALLETQGSISLKPAKRQITILFADIRNFTSKCEQLAAEEIVRYLNAYFTEMVEAIFSHKGTVNKFVGDMIVAMFGAPWDLADPEKKAIEAAIEMQRRLEIIPVPWIRDNFKTGIGISSGEVVVGNIGSPQHTDYTAIGDEVNIASRLQSIAKGGQILCSQSVYDRVKDLFAFKDLGPATVKGKKKAVEIFEVLYENEATRESQTAGKPENQERRPACPTN